MWMLPQMSVDDIIMYLRKSRTDDPALTVQEVLSKHEQMLDDWAATQQENGLLYPHTG